MKIIAAVIGMGVGKKHLEAIDGYMGSTVKIICEKELKSEGREGIKMSFKDKIKELKNLTLRGKEINEEELYIGCSIGPVYHPILGRIKYCLCLETR